MTGFFPQDGEPALSVQVTGAAGELEVDAIALLDRVDHKHSRRIVVIQ